MARTSAKAKKQKQDNPSQNGQKDVTPASENANEDTNGSTDKENDDSNTDYEVEHIVHTRIYRGKRQYLIRWKGYKEDGDTWENESVIQSCTDALEVFKKKNPNLLEKSKPSDDEGEDDDKTSETTKSKKVVKKASGTGKKTGKNKKNDEAPETGTEVEGEAAEESDSESAKGKKRAKEPAKKVPTKKSKQESQGKTAGKSDDTDDESTTDGKNYEVEKILEVHTKKNGSKEFLIRWKGYKPSDDTWEPEEHLDCQDLIERFMEKVDKAKSLTMRELRESRTPTKRFIINTKGKGQRTNLRNSGVTNRPCYHE